jgi:hypothetical protein
MKPKDFETIVLESLNRIEKRLNRVEIRTAVLAATVGLIVRYLF